MAESASYPQIPTTVWWGVRALLNRSPRASITEDFLGIELSVQPAAARQYVSELKRVGLLSEDSKATELANRWRMDETYPDAVNAILEKAYDEELLHLAPTPVDRNKAIMWFQRQGLGEGSARNKAATYALIASALPGESPTKSTSSTPRPKVQRAKKPANGQISNGQTAAETPLPPSEMETPSIFPVNLNLQIHISADASTDQIDAIFSSMRKHLGNARIS